MFLDSRRMSIGDDDGVGECCEKSLRGSEVLLMGGRAVDRWVERGGWTEVCQERWRESVDILLCDWAGARVGQKAEGSDKIAYSWYDASSPTTWLSVESSTKTRSDAVTEAFVCWHEKCELTTEPERYYGAKQARPLFTLYKDPA